MTDGSCSSCGTIYYKRKENPCSGFKTCDCGGEIGTNTCISGSITKYQTCKECCDSKYQYDSSNCPLPQELSGGSCGGKFEKCIMPLQYLYSDHSLSSEIIPSKTIVGIAVDPDNRLAVAIGYEKPAGAVTGLIFRRWKIRRGQATAYMLKEKEIHTKSATEKKIRKKFWLTARQTISLTPRRKQQTNISPKAVLAAAGAAPETGIFRPIIRSSPILTTGKPSLKCWRLSINFPMTGGIPEEISIRLRLMKLMTNNAVSFISTWAEWPAAASKYPLTNLMSSFLLSLIKSKKPRRQGGVSF